MRDPFRKPARNTVGLGKVQPEAHLQHGRRNCEGARERTRRFRTLHRCRCVAHHPRRPACAAQAVDPVQRVLGRLGQIGKSLAQQRLGAVSLCGARHRAPNPQAARARVERSFD